MMRRGYGHAGRSGWRTATPEPRAIAVRRQGGLGRLPWERLRVAGAKTRLEARALSPRLSLATC